MPSFRTQRAGRPALALLIVAVAITIGACASSGGSAILSTVGAPVGGASGAEAPAYDVATGAEYPSAAASAAPAMPEQAPPGSTENGDNAVGGVDDARIVRTGTMELEVKDVASAVTKARSVIRGMGGYIGASDTTSDGDTPVAVITYRIPVDRWEDALAALRTLDGETMKIVTEQTQAVEVTGQIVDLEARIKNLRASEAALQAIAARAVKVSDVLEVENQLTDVRGQIEVLTGELTQLGNRADLATLAVTFRVPVVAVQVAQHDWDPAGEVDQATASLVGILQNLAGAGIWFLIVWLPMLVVLGILGGITVWFLRRTGLLRRTAPPPPTSTPPAPPATGSGPGTPATGTGWGS
jgi:Domain of unknown function (DUF4349)